MDYNTYRAFFWGRWGPHKGKNPSLESSYSTDMDPLLMWVGPRLREHDLAGTHASRAVTIRAPAQSAAGGMYEYDLIRWKAR